MGIVQTWDTHVDNWGRSKNVLLPQLDLALGVDDHAELRDPLGRPNRLLNGEVIEQLYTGA